MLGLGSGINRLSAAEAAAIAGRIPGFTGLLDESYGSGATAAYSVRQLSSSETVAMTIRRDSDNSELDIGFDSEGNLDESAISTFCSGTTCKVSSWRDQSGNRNDATQATAANQPTIYTGGAIVKENGKVAVSFDGTNDGFPLDTTSLDIGSLSSFTTGKFNATSGSGMMLSLSGQASNKRWYAPYLANTNFNFGYANSGTAVNTGADTNRHLFTMIAGTTLNSMQAWASSASVGTATLTTGIDSTKNGIGNLNGALYANCNVQESIFYTSDKSSVRTSIESNVGGYFTQNTPLLDTYTGAAAAYSLRKLRSAFSGSAIRVRRASDNAESDIGFNVFGELSTVELAAHCGSSDGYCVRWYDQSGNANDATQTTTANQPKIYDGTTGVTLNSNSKPAVYFQDNVANEMTVAAGYASDPYFITAVSEVPTGVTDGRSDIYSNGSAGNVPNGTRLLNWENAFVSIWNGDGSSFDRNDKTETATLDTTILITGYNVSGNMYIFRDGVAGGSNPVSTSISTTQTSGFIHGNRNTRPNYIAEIVIYDSDQSSNRTGIESNINTFYSIY